MITEQQIKEAADNSVNGMHTSFDGIEISLAHTGFEHGAEWAIKQLQPKWIPVSERMPEVGEFVLVHRIEGYYSVDQYRQLHGDVKSFVYNVTHWMPLPQPPNH